MFLVRVIFLSFATLTFVLAGNPYWVFFEDDSTRIEVQLTARADARLSLKGSPQPIRDFSVSPNHLATLRSAGFKIRHASRLLNAVSLELEDDVGLNYLIQLPFVTQLKPVARSVFTAPRQDQINTQLARISNLPYGQSLAQNEMLNIPAIHDLGYDGSGVLIGVFDTGFLTDHPVFDELDIWGRHDFVDHEVDPNGVGHSHGISVLSVLGGYSPGELIGPAYGASFLLARTENVIGESRIEEDNWVAALEWADSLGVDIISSSLNYRDFDGTAEDYPDSAIDGETTIISRAANIAAERGILVVNSASNDGPSTGSIWPPADSRHVLSVGAVTAEGEIAYFSSRGPTYDGRIKPDVVAMGVSVYMASSIDGYQRSNGTSFSTPLVAGLSALLLQAHPELKPDSVIALFHQNGDQAASPDNVYGHGLPDLSHLFQKLQDIESTNIPVYPNPSSEQIVKLVLPGPMADKIKNGDLFDIRGRKIASLLIEPVSPQIVQVTLPLNSNLANQLTIITLYSDDQVYSGKLVYLKP
ncbi:MAG: S8 family serine peptidase [Candidatus Marinimicrobia bacterium]|nr:S8 family serine peptidase [Candidatus Neomarinimicrobiota bacterium]